MRSPDKSSTPADRYARLRDEEAKADRAEFDAWLDAVRRGEVYADWSPARACTRASIWPPTEGDQIFV